MQSILFFDNLFVENKKTLSYKLIFWWRFQCILELNIACLMGWDRVISVTTVWHCLTILTLHNKKKHTVGWTSAQSITCLRTKLTLSFKLIFWWRFQCILGLYIACQHFCKTYINFMLHSGRTFAPLTLIEIPWAELSTVWKQIRWQPLRRSSNQQHNHSIHHT